MTYLPLTTCMLCAVDCDICSEGISVDNKSHNVWSLNMLSHNNAHESCHKLKQIH